MSRLNQLLYSTLFVIALLIANGDTLQLRILFKIGLVEEQLREAQHLGKLYAFVYDVACSLTLLSHEWLNDCRLSKYHTTNLPSPRVTVIVESETSSEADEALCGLNDDDERLFVISNRLNSDILDLKFVVDVPRQGDKSLGDFFFNKDGLPQMRTVTQYFVEMDEVEGIQINHQNFGSLTSALCKQLQSDFTAILGVQTRLVNVIPMRVLEIQGKTVVAALANFDTIFQPTETAYPEQWKMRLQGVIDSLRLHKGIGRNFRLPVPEDVATDEYLIFGVAMYVPEFGRYVASLSATSLECRLLDSIFELLAPMDYACHGWGFYVSDAEAALYAKVRVVINRSMLSAQLVETEPSSLAFLGLLRSKCQWAFFSLIKLDGLPSYEYYTDEEHRDHFFLVVETYPAHIWTTGVPELSQLNSAGERMVAEGELLTALQRDLSLSPEVIRCRLLEYVLQGSRIVLQAHIQVHKQSDYWDDQEPWVAPVRMSHVLNSQQPHVTNVHWRHKRKYFH